MKNLYFFFLIIGALILPGCNDRLQRKTNKALNPVYSKRLIKKSQSALALIESEYAFELDLASKRCSRKEVRKALEQHVPQRCLTGIRYRVAEYMVGAYTKDAPYIFYKMDLDREEKNLKKLRKQLKNCHADHELMARLKSHQKKLHSINMAVCYSKEFLVEAYEHFGKEK